MPEDESYDQDAAISDEASHVWVCPGVLAASGVLATAFRLWPEMMTPDGIADADFVAYHLMVGWIFFAAFTTIAWTVPVLVMMKIGPDRWPTFPEQGNGSDRRCGNSFFLASFCSSSQRPSQ